MLSIPIVIAVTALITVAVILLIENFFRTRALATESEKSRQRRLQHITLLDELKSLRKELARAREVADQLPLIAKNLTQKVAPEAIPAIAVRAFKEFFHATRVGYFTPLGTSSEYTLEVGAGFPPEWHGGIRVTSDEGMLGLALQRRSVVSRDEPHLSPGRKVPESTLEHLGISPDFVVPVFGIAEIIGAVVVDGSPFPPAEERKYVSMLADLISVATQRATLADAKRSVVWRDELTGVAKRAYFLQRFEAEIRRTQDYQQPCALFMFDVDRFKVVNDTYGHAAGDIVIRKVAEIAMLNTRSSDLVGRFGGDEFLVLITSAAQEQAFQYCENVRKKFAGTEIRIPGLTEPIRLTISGGLSVFPDHGLSTADLTRAADHALYEAKRRGRNQTVIATPETLGQVFPGSPAEPANEPGSRLPDDKGRSDGVPFPFARPLNP